MDTTQETKDALLQIETKFKEITKGFALDADVKQELTGLKEEYKALKAEIKASNDLSEGLTKLNEIAEKQGLMIEDLKTAKIPHADSLTLVEQVKAQFETHKDKFENFRSKTSPFKFELKAAGTMTYSNITGSTTLLPTPEMIPGYNPARRNPATFLDAVSVGTTGSARIAYVDQVSADGTAATVTEGSAKPAIDVDYKVSYSSAVKVAANTKISDEMLDDIDFMAQAVADELVSRVRIAASGNIYTYITSGMTPGYTTVNAAFADYYPLARPANLWDVLTAAKATIAAGNHEANTVFLNPLTHANLWLIKTTAADYTRPVLVTPTEFYHNGMRIISTNAVSGDKYIVCDINKLNVKMYKDMTVEAGWVNDDFTKNLRTFVGECRVHYYVKDNDLTAFLYGDLSTDADYMTAAS
jgi:hypothetical protein